VARELDIEEKKLWIEAKCDEHRIHFTRDALTLVIDRANILEDSYQQYITTDGFDFHKEVKIFFVGEVAQDAGGLMREWITELTKVIFNDEIGLFKLNRGETDMSYFFNSYAKFSFPESEYLGLFRFAGSILAKALFDKIPILPKLNKVIFRKLVCSNQRALLDVRLEDLRDFDY
jgi:hypothetical protein